MPITKTIPKELITLIEVQPLLQCLPENARYNLIHEASLISFHENDRLINEDEANDFLFLLLKGKAEAVINGTAVGMLEAGDIAGEISISGISPPIADVIAKTEVDAVAFSAQSMKEAIDAHPEFGKRLKEAALRRISG